MLFIFPTNQLARPFDMVCLYIHVHYLYRTLPYIINMENLYKPFLHMHELVWLYTLLIINPYLSPTALYRVFNTAYKHCHMDFEVVAGTHWYLFWTAHAIPALEILIVYKGVNWVSWDFLTCNPYDDSICVAWLLQLHHNIQASPTKIAMTDINTNSWGDTHKFRLYRADSRLGW